MNEAAYRSILRRLGAEPPPPQPEGIAPLSPLTRRDVLPTPDGSPQLKPSSTPTSAYVATLGALWALGAEGPDADRAAIRRLLGEVARQCDELGAEVALAVSRHAAREWSAREGRCAYCAMPGIFHDPDTGEALHVGRPRG